MDLSSITSVIQLAVAPVFLLAAVAGLLNVATSRLARIIDRIRVLTRGDERNKQEEQELLILSRRVKLINLATGLYTFSALLVCCVIVTLFLFLFLKVAAAVVIAGLFVLAMLCLVIGLLLFQQEIYLAIKTVKVMQL